jgi:hypothetical protein
MLDQLVEIVVLETCCGCGIPFGMTQGFMDMRRNDGEIFYCPNGHSQHYAHSTKEKLEDMKKALSNAQQDTRWWREEAESKAKSLSATKGQVTRIKNRIAKGICPCCNRQFLDLNRHMDNQHPEYIKKEKE